MLYKLPVTLHYINNAKIFKHHRWSRIFKIFGTQYLEGQEVRRRREEWKQRRPEPVPEQKMVMMMMMKLEEW